MTFDQFKSYFENQKSPYEVYIAMTEKENVLATFSVKNDGGLEESFDKLKDKKFTKYVGVNKNIPMFE